MPLPLTHHPGCLNLTPRFFNQLPEAPNRLTLAKHQIQEAVLTTLGGLKSGLKYTLRYQNLLPEV